MTPQEWLNKFDDTNDKFKWFIVRYLNSMWISILEARKESNWVKMITLMNYVWFELPDNQFNIIENPEGWNEFISLLEELPEY